MFKTLTKMVFSSFILTSLHLYAEDYDFKPGLWEITTTMEIVDAPPEVKEMMKMGGVNAPRKTKKCFKSVETMFDPEPGDVEQCKININHISFNKMSFENLCTDPEGVLKKAVGEVNFNGKSMTGQFESTMSDKVNSQIMKMKMKMVSNAKYIGVCN